jgi:hypothetical protein
MSFESVMPPYNSTDPAASFVGTSCLDFLLIELVPMAYRITNELDEAASAGGLKPISGQDTGSGSTTTGTGTAASGAGPGAVRKMEEDEERDAVFFRLEMLGYRVGQGLVER